MALPKIKHSVYKHHLKGIDKTVSFRPYTNAEQKILLLAKDESEENKERILESVMQILSNCILDDIDVYNMPMFDVEDIFVRIREKSVGEVIPVRFKYNYQEDDVTKTDFVTVNVNTQDIKLVGNFDKESRVIIVDETQGLGVKLRHPTLKDINDLYYKNDDYELIKRCIDLIFDNDEVYDMSQVTDEELDEFMDDIEGLEMMKIKKFFDEMPSLFYETDVYKPKLDETETVTIKGLQGFFT